MNEILGLLAMVNILIPAGTRGPALRHLWSMNPAFGDIKKITQLKCNGPPAFTGCEWKETFTVMMHHTFYPVITNQQGFVSQHCPGWSTTWAQAHEGGRTCAQTGSRCQGHLGRCSLAMGLGRGDRLWYVMVLWGLPKMVIVHPQRDFTYQKLSILSPQPKSIM